MTVSKGPAVPIARDVVAPQVASSAEVVGDARAGEGAILAKGAVIRASDDAVEIGTSSAVLETSLVVVLERTIIGAGGKIIGDSHGPVRIGADVQILENTVLHLLPANELIIADGVAIGPGAMIHGCKIGAQSVVEPGAIVCDGREVGAGCVVRAGPVVKQRSRFPDGVEIDGFPATAVGPAPRPARPAWAFDPTDLAIRR